MYKEQKAVADHAQANQHKPKPSTPPSETISEPLAETSIDGFDNLVAITIDVDIKGVSVEKILTLNISLEVPVMIHSGMTRSQPVSKLRKRYQSHHC